MQGPYKYLPESDVTGTQVNYYFVCKRKLWFHTHGMDQEGESDLVRSGRFLHESTYKRYGLRNIEIDRAKLDFAQSNEVHEIKRSRTIELAHKYQLLFYLYLIQKQSNVKVKGILHYPLLKRVVNVELTKQNEEEIENIISDLEQIKRQEKPPQKERKPYCRTCAFCDLCWG